jgi:hypothetical protein
MRSIIAVNWGSIGDTIAVNWGSIEDTIAVNWGSIGGINWY